MTVGGNASHDLNGSHGFHGSGLTSEVEVVELAIMEGTRTATPHTVDVKEQPSAL